MGSAASSVTQGCEKLGEWWTTYGQHPSHIDVHGATYRIDRLVGEGANSFVYSATDPIGRGKMALKRYQLGDVDARRMFEEECRIHRNVCPNDYIVAFVDCGLVSRRDNTFVGAPEEGWLVMEIMEGGSLEVLVNRRLTVGCYFTAFDLLSMMLQMLCCVSHLHSMSVCHWDIKLGNFLIDQGEGALKLCDFGSASTCKYVCRSRSEVLRAEEELSRVLTYLYRPPETLDLWSGKCVSEKVDVWSLGVAFYIMIFFEMPFEENALEIIAGIPKRVDKKTNKLVPPIGKFGEHVVIVDALCAIIKDMMLVPDPDTRADVFDVWDAMRRVADLVNMTKFPMPSKRPQKVDLRSRFSDDAP